jgi:hypothetical protein
MGRADASSSIIGRHRKGVNVEANSAMGELQEWYQSSVPKSTENRLDA